MADSPSFADFVKEAREKKKNEALAQQFLGSRKGTPSGAGIGRAKSTKPAKPDLLSRMSSNGVQKRSSSAKPAGNIDAMWEHDLHPFSNTSRSNPKRLNRTASASQIERNTRNFDKFSSSLSRTAQVIDDTPQLSIKGAASGPHIVMASNFASGTTAADIESVMGGIGGELLSCKIVMPRPTVMAELTFATREGAENVIATFNNKKADGKVLYVYYKSGPGAAAMHGRPPVGRLESHSFDDMDIDTNAGARTASYTNGRNGFPDRRVPPSGPRRRY